MVDPRAASGFAGAVEAYERGRPRYPEAALALLVRELGLTRSSVVLDLAAGTGKLTRDLLPRVGRVMAVDPGSAMLARLRSALPAVEARLGTAEAIPLEDASVDAVFVGEAFHWFDAERAVAEVARVLRPGGGLAALWNRARWDGRALPWLREFDALVTPPREAAGPFPAADGRWQEALRRSQRFLPLREDEVRHVQRQDADGVVALVASWSWIANLADAEREELLRKLAALLGDAGELVLDYVTEIHWTRLAGPRG